MKKFFVFVFILISPTALADVYKCTKGSSTFYSDRPCPKEQSTQYIEIQKETSSIEIVNDKELSEKVFELCVNQLAKWFNFKDPDSIKTSGSKVLFKENIKKSHFSGLGLSTIVSVNAKNSYGAYTGYESHICYTNEDGSIVVDYK